MWRVGQLRIPNSAHTILVFIDWKRVSEKTFVDITMAPLCTTGDPVQERYARPRDNGYDNIMLLVILTLR
jgi:hypothetical protein